jgi:hypothetical protein
VVKDKIANFLGRLIQEDYVGLEDDLKNIVYTKIAINVDREVQKLKDRE